jgi:hypothetical protein
MGIEIVVERGFDKRSAIYQNTIANECQTDFLKNEQK